MADATIMEMKIDDELKVPDSLALLPLQNGVLFPDLTVPLYLSRPCLLYTSDAADDLLQV